MLNNQDNGEYRKFKFIALVIMLNQKFNVQFGNMHFTKISDTLPLRDLGKFSKFSIHNFRSSYSVSSTEMKQNTRMFEALKKIKKEKEDMEKSLEECHKRRRSVVLKYTKLASQCKKYVNTNNNQSRRVKSKKKKKIIGINNEIRI